MSHEMVRTAPCSVQISTEVSPEEVAGEREAMVRRWVASARIDGFRPGKAPRSLVERRFAEGIREDLEEALIRRLWEEVQDEAELRPAGPLSVKEAAWQGDGSFRITAELEVYPEIELPAIDGYSPPAFPVEPSDEEVERTLDGLRDRHAAWEPAEGEAVAEGMLVEAEVNGEFPDGGGEPFHEERSLFQIGAGEIYAEIEAAVVGKQVGEEATAERILGPEAGEERLGKKVLYTITVKSLRRKRLPDADDAFAESLGIPEGLETLREKVREGLLREKKRLRREVWRGTLVQYLGGEKAPDVPDAVVKEETREELVRFAQSLARRGVDPEKADIEWPKVEAEIREKVGERLRAELLVDALADHLGTEVEEAAVDAEIQQEAKRMGVPFAELKGNLAKSGGVGRIRAILRREGAVDEVLRPHLAEATSDAGSDSR